MVAIFVGRAHLDSSRDSDGPSPPAKYSFTYLFTTQERFPPGGGGMRRDIGGPA